MSLFIEDGNFHIGNGTISSGSVVGVEQCKETYFLTQKVNQPTGSIGGELGGGEVELHSRGELQLNTPQKVPGSKWNYKRLENSLSIFFVFLILKTMKVCMISRFGELISEQEVSRFQSLKWKGHGWGRNIFSAPLSPAEPCHGAVVFKQFPGVQEENSKTSIYPYWVHSLKLSISCAVLWRVERIR